MALTGGLVGKITRNDKGAWTWSTLHHAQDLALAEWSSVPDADLPAGLLRCAA